MLAIRMRRVGSKKRPFFRLVVARSEAARDGSFIEILGNYYPRAKPAKIEVDRERVNHWVSKGAKPSNTVRTLIARHLPDVPAAAEAAPVTAPAAMAAAPVAQPQASAPANAEPAGDAEAPVPASGE